MKDGYAADSPLSARFSLLASLLVVATDCLGITTSLFLRLFVTKILAMEMAEITLCSLAIRILSGRRVFSHLGD